MAGPVNGGASRNNGDHYLMHHLMHPYCLIWTRSVMSTASRGRQNRQRGLSRPLKALNQILDVHYTLFGCE